MEYYIFNLKKTKYILSFLKKAITNPEKSRSDTQIFSKILMKPVIFDLYSLFLQAFDLKAIYDIKLPKKNKNSNKTIAIRHNLLEIQDKVITTTRRVETAYQIATTPWKNNKNSKLLIIGCRNIVELRQATFFGFRWKNIDGLDLFSTNKKIIESNMEDMKNINSGSYDFVTMVNTLSYSDKPQKVLNEIYRVLKPHGKLIFNFSFNLKAKRTYSKYTGEKFVDYTKFREKDMNYLINKTGFEVYFRHYYEKTSSTYKENIMQVTWYGLLKKLK